MWPLRRPVGESGRSRFTREPGRSAPRLLRRRVSGARSAENPSGRGSTAVRHTPLTLMLAPAAVSAITVDARTFRRAPAGWGWSASTAPSSSIIPVNIRVASLSEPGLNGPLLHGHLLHVTLLHIPLHCEFVWRYGVDGHIPDADGVHAAAPADTAGQRQRLHPAQDLGAVIEKDAIHHAGFKR